MGLRGWTVVRWFVVNFGCFIVAGSITGWSSPMLSFWITIGCAVWCSLAGYLFEKEAL